MKKRESTKRLYRYILNKAKNEIITSDDLDNFDKEALQLIEKLLVKNQ